MDIAWDSGLSPSSVERLFYVNHWNVHCDHVSDDDITVNTTAEYIVKSDNANLLTEYVLLT